MPSKAPETDDASAIVEHFKALPFEQQLTCLKDIQAVVDESASERRAALLAQLSQLDALTGRPGASADKSAGDAQGRSRGPVAPKYRSRKDPNQVWSGRGG